MTGNLNFNKTMISFDPGLIIWTTIIFTLLLIVLKKFAWKPILKAVEERNNSIEQALRSADKAKQEMELLNADNERILTEAKKERDALLKEAREIKLTNIFDAVDEKVKTVQCKKESKKGCNGKSTKCLTHNLWDELENHINSFFDEKSLEDLVKDNIERRV